MDTYPFLELARVIYTLQGFQTSLVTYPVLINWKCVCMI